MAGEVKSTPDQLSGTINEIMEDYRDYCRKVTYEDLDEAGKFAVKKVKD